MSGVKNQLQSYINDQLEAKVEQENQWKDSFNTNQSNFEKMLLSLKENIEE
jgi:hypothetical protein